MNVKDIVQGNRVYFDVDEMTFLVEEYIQVRKGRTVRIDILSHCVNPAVRGGVNVLLYKMQVKKLVKAFNVAYAYFKEL